METITTIGLDIAKNSFAVHGFDAGGVTVLVKELKSVDLVLRSNAKEPDPRAMPAGIALFALGFLIFVRSRRGAKVVVAVEAAKPKWGRDAGA